MLVRQVVGQLELVEGDDLLHPLLAGGRAVGVDVHPLGHLGVRLAGHDPPTEKKLLSFDSTPKIFIIVHLQSSHFLLK